MHRQKSKQKPFEITYFAIAGLLAFISIGILISFTAEDPIEQNSNIVTQPVDNKICESYSMMNKIEIRHNSSGKYYGINNTFVEESILQEDCLK